MKRKIAIICAILLSILLLIVILNDFQTSRREQLSSGLICRLWSNDEANKVHAEWCLNLKEPEQCILSSDQQKRINKFKSELLKNCERDPEKVIRSLSK